ncbi:MAG: hypothetical protein K8R85_12045, partial [Bacteroidetes bacterium]|nr:hypothetical protein [Bacteroidota bacterium]
MKKIFKITILALLSIFVGISTVNTLGLPPLLVLGGLVAFSLIPMPTGVASMAVALNSVIIAELRKQFKDMDASFLNPIKSFDDKVNNDIINFNEIGADPAVLVDNVTYPIAVNGRTDDKIPVSLHKFDTENTKITDDELQALPYDKKSSVMMSHKEALMRTYLKLGAHSLAPAADAVSTPVFKTTGATVGLRKRLKVEDLVAYKELIDALEIPIEMRHLVLSSAHVNDLLLIDQTFRDRYYNTESGKIIKNIYGFNIFESLHTPKYVGTTYAKKAFGAAAAATDINSSVFFSNLNAMKAIGSISMYR